MKKQKTKIKKIETEIVCNCCFGKESSCKICNGTGKKIDYHYIITSNNIAIDGDTLK